MDEKLEKSTSSEEEDSSGLKSVHTIGRNLQMLPHYKNEVEPIHLLGFNIARQAKWMQFVLLSGAIFVLYVGYGYMQELLFKMPGLKTFGWTLTFIQFLIYSACGYGECRLWHNTRRMIPWRIYMVIAFFTVATMGLSNSSVAYLNYPTQVIFKCCKLIPVMIGGVLIQGKRYGLLDISSVILMSLGIVMFTLADNKVSPIFDSRGYIMISGALLADAVIGNIQEKNMKKYGGSSNEVVLYSYGLGSIFIFVYILLSGEIFESIPFLIEHFDETFWNCLIFSFLGYLGVNVVLTHVKVFGALLAVTVTTLRKALTIILSFILFSKPFTLDYLWAGMVVMIAIYLNLYSKNKSSWDQKIRVLFASVIGYSTSSSSSIHRDTLLV